MVLPEKTSLNIGALSHLFDNMSESYKLFWFRAIVDIVISGKKELQFKDILNNMIADAWYMVSEYHLNLGPSDSLEMVVNYLSTETSIKSNEKKEKIVDFLNYNNDDVYLDKIKVLSYNVPYRLLSPFIPSLKGKGWNIGKSKLCDRINQEDGLIYYFKKYDGINSIIELDTEWYNYIIENQIIIKGWIEYNLINYLQKRNPNVPGILLKIRPPMDRKLEKVKKYWKAISEIENVFDVYGDNYITKKDISIDHFVPWSFVAHDELWNLHPTTRSINSSKSNNLPDWDRYIEKYCKIQYLAYQAIWKYEKIHSEFEKCANDHINSMDVKLKLYRKGLQYDEFKGTLVDIVKPVYISAGNAGFKSWIL